MDQFLGGRSNPSQITIKSDFFFEFGDLSSEERNLLEDPCYRIS